jgi:hypothetical protein
VAVEEPPNHGRGEALAAIGDQPLLDFQQRQVRLAAIEAEQVIPMGLDPSRPAVPTHRRRRDHTRGLEARRPAHRAGDAHAKTLGRPVARHPPFHHSIHNTFAKIVRKRHPRRLLRAASLKNHKPT